MGGTESKSDKSDIKHELLFNNDERDRVSLVFCSISHGQKTFEKDRFQHFTNPVLDQFTSSRMFDMFEGPLLTQLRQDQQHHHKSHIGHHSSHVGSIHLPHFASHLAVLLKGDVSDLSSACMFLASTNPSAVPASELVQFIATVLHSYEKLLSAHSAAYQSWIFSSAGNDEGRHKRLACSLLKSLLKAGHAHALPFASVATPKDQNLDVCKYFFPKEENQSIPVPHPSLHLNLNSKSGAEFTLGPSEAAEESSTLCFSSDQVHDWLCQCPTMQHILREVFKGAVQFYPAEPHQIEFEPQLPQVRNTNWSQFHTILDFSTVLFLTTALPFDLRSPWSLAYSNRLHGHSFSRLLHLLTSMCKPSLLVVRDRGGKVFGGFAAVPWKIGPKFIGNHTCFLFEVGSKFCIYKPTGYNTNYMYLNAQQQTMPNGLGMGGQFEYFGLWIDQSFDHGHSKAGRKGCTTYGSPQLSGEAEFEIDVIEVWSLGKKKKKDGAEDEEGESDEENEGAKMSILDKLEDADKAILDMADRGTRSDHLREEPIIEETAAHNTIISPY